MINEISNPELTFHGHNGNLAIVICTSTHSSSNLCTIGADLPNKMVGLAFKYLAKSQKN